MTIQDYKQHLVIFCELGQVDSIVENEITGLRCLSLQSKRKGIDKRFQDYATQVFEEVQNLIKEKTKGKVLIQIVIPYQTKEQLYSGLSGLLRTAQLENPKIIGQ